MPQHTKILFVGHSKILHKHCISFSWGHITPSAVVSYCTATVLNRITQVLILVPQMQEIEVLFTTLALRDCNYVIYG